MITTRAPDGANKTKYAKELLAENASYVTSARWWCLLHKGDKSSRCESQSQGQVDAVDEAINLCTVGIWRRRMVGLGLAIDLLLTDARSSRKVFRSTFLLIFWTKKRAVFLKKNEGSIFIENQIKSNVCVRSSSHEEARTRLALFVQRHCSLIFWSW